MRGREQNEKGCSGVVDRCEAVGEQNETGCSGVVDRYEAAEGQL